jgi:1-phosphofructokinase family hexose kinase
MEEKKDHRNECSGFHQNHRDVYGLSVNVAIETRSGKNRGPDIGDQFYDIRWNSLWVDFWRAPETDPTMILKGNAMIFTVTFNPALDKEYTVPRLEFNEVLRANTVRVNYGGKGFNVSRMLISLGVNNTALGFIGGETGRIIQDGLLAGGIETAFTEIAGEARTNVSIVSNADQSHIKVNEPGPTISVDEIPRLMEQVELKVRAGDWWVLAGSLPPGIADDIYAQIICRVQQGGAFAVLDTSGPPLQAGIRAKLCLIKPNIKEVSQLINKEVKSLSDMQAALPDLHALVAGMVAISAGKQGALLSNGQDHWFKRAVEIQESNPIGAGDAMVAGLVWRLSQNDEPQNALA